MIGTLTASMSESQAEFTVGNSPWEAIGSSILITLFPPPHTLWNRCGLVRGLRQLVCWQGRHGGGRESSRNEMVESHQLIGPSLLPPSGTAVAKPDLWI